MMLADKTYVEYEQPTAEKIMDAVRSAYRESFSIWGYERSYYMASTWEIRMKMERDTGLSFRSKDIRKALREMSNVTLDEHQSHRGMCMWNIGLN